MERTAEGKSNSEESFGNSRNGNAADDQCGGSVGSVWGVQPTTGYQRWFSHVSTVAVPGASWKVEEEAISAETRLSRAT